MLRLFKRPKIRHLPQVRPGGEPSDYASYEDWVAGAFRPTAVKELSIELCICHDEDPNHSALVKNVMEALNKMLVEAEPAPKL